MLTIAEGERAVALAGTVTFVLGDVEDSTRAWEARPADMSRWMSELSRLVDELTEKFDGDRPVEQGEGDSFVVAFARAVDAVGFATALQRALRDGDLAVRVGVHAGDSETRDGRYEGAAIIRAARLRDLGHGGQILLSQAVADLAADALPDGAGLLSLGVFRLKGLDRPEAVIQLTHAELPLHFPPLRAVRPGTGLPVPVSSFVGFVDELAEVCDLVRTQRIVTIAGAGGCGKTRLAVETARRVGDGFPGGIAFCDLAPIGDGAGVAQVLCTALGFRTSGHESDTDIACARLAATRTLVVLDNCEHLIEAAAALADALLRHCPDVVVLATSREPLGVPSEVTWRVPPLDPESSAQLFTDRARQVRPAAEDESSRAAILDICARVEGIPLAIELAAARTRVMAPEQIAESLKERFTLLGTGPRTSLARQQTLEASLGWSHDLLTEEQRVVYRRVAAFAGGFGFAQAEQVVAGDGIRGADVLDLLTQLVDRSLLVADGARFRMLEVMRHDARERLFASGESRAVLTRHLAAYVDWATPLGADVRSGRKPYAVAIGELDAEYANIRAAVEWALHEGDAVAGLRIVNVLWTLWFRMRTAARMKEARGWLDELLALGAELPPDVRCTALVALTYSTETQYDWTQGESWGREALALALELGDEPLAAQAATFLGLAQGNLGLDEGLESLAVAVELGRRSGEWISTVIALREQVFQRLFRNQVAEALAAGQAAVAAMPDAGAVAQLRATVTGIVGWAEATAGDVERGEANIAEAVAVLEAAGDLYSQATARMIWGAFALVRGDVDAAEERLSRALAVATESGFETTIALIEANVARILLLRGDLAGCEAMLDHADTLFDRMHGRLVDMFRAGVLLVRAMVALRLGDVERAVTLARGSVADGSELAMIGRVTSYVLVAMLERQVGEIVAAEAAVAEALSIVQRGSWAVAAEPLAMCAILRADVGDDADAVRLFGAADAARRAIGAVPDVELQLPEAEVIAQLRARVDGAQFVAAWDEGAALSAQDAVAFGLRGRGARKRPAVGWDSLTPTEVRVADLVAEGLTNKQIATRLLMSPRTVSTHLSHAFAKLGVSRRSELAVMRATR